ncbi:hypothetical protein PVAND_015884 [Polypedilum vanderplanki]|uniref:trypsin n=1 Tax=Polypedilum vanderplanki TaxID=319348 RepID=A0A9J6BE75_POLVA|nr:hypothetical protein PVAND_015884 [Polypedilum vanderplanki]
MKVFIIFSILFASTLAFPYESSINENPLLMYNSIRLPMEPESRIVGGDQHDIYKYPYICSLQWNGSHRCGANIISHRFLVTAAHCTIGLTPTLLTVRCGSSRFDSGGRVYRISTIINHPDYNSATIDYDFAVIETEEEIEFNEATQPIRLADQDEELPHGHCMKTLGWGNTMDPSQTRDYLRIVYVPKVFLEECRRLYSTINAAVTERMICAGFSEGGHDACQGDSGGPLADGSYDDVRCRFHGKRFAAQPRAAEGRLEKLYGIVSWGFGCARPNFPGVYSRVASVSNWIKRHAHIKDD